MKRYYIVEIDDSVPNMAELFVGQIRNGKELIPCLECKYLNEDMGMCTHEKSVMGNLLCLECDADHYCSYAERKED